MQNSSPWTPCGGDYSGPSCTQFIDGGLRNAWGQLIHGPKLSLGIIEGLTFDLSFAWIKSYLYGLKPTDNTPETQANFQRQAQVFEGGLTYDATDFLSVSLGFSSIYGDLARDGTTQNPLFNRYTQITLGFSIAIDPIVTKFQ
ncbi:MAG: hypothetical protein QM765_22000 [Myxococcales bacterium]